MKKMRKLLKRIAYGQSYDFNEVDRDKWVVSKLKELESGKRILDAGAGECKYKRFCKHLKYTSQDFCQYTGGKEYTYGMQPGEWDTSRIDIVSDITDIPVDSGAFDAILCTEVLEHIPHPEKAITEFSRILPEGGILILTAPFCSMTHFAPFHFCTGFNRFWYETILGENGFKIVEIVPNGNYYGFVINEVQRTMSMHKKDLLLVLRGKWFKRSLKKYYKCADSKADTMCYGYHVVAVKQSQ